MKVYILTETHEQYGIRDFNIISVRTDKEESKREMEELVEADHYEDFKDNGIEDEGGDVLREWIWRQRLFHSISYYRKRSGGINMMITRKIWIIEADNDECWSEPIIKYSAVEAENYVLNEFDDALAENPDFNDYWEIEDGTGTASVSNDYGNYYSWRITEHEIEIDVDVVINVK